jgi:sporulation protein YlmC with PRC-barrel domain
MKNFTVGVLVASLSLLGMEAVAQQSPAPRVAAPSAGPGSAIESEKLIGARIKTPANKDMGEIDALLVDPTDGKVTHVVIGVGGITGIGETQVVMPWSDIQLRAVKNRVEVVVDKAALDSAPKFEKRRREADLSIPAASPRTEEKKK